MFDYRIGAKQYLGKMILLPRLFRGYRGNFPAAPVESAPIVICHTFLPSCIVIHVCFHNCNFRWLYA